MPLLKYNFFLLDPFQELFYKSLIVKKFGSYFKKGLFQDQLLLIKLI